MATITEVKMWTDDHLPCLSFIVDNKLVELWWTDPKLHGRVQACEDGDMPFEAIFRHHPIVAKIIADPANVDLTGTGAAEDTDEDAGPNVFGFDCSAGRLTVTIC